MNTRNSTRVTHTVKSPDFVLLSPLSPELFGYSNEEVKRMISELALVGIKVMLVDQGREMFFFARSSSKETLEALCTNYDIGGILVEASAIYDQVQVPEIV